MATKDRPLSDDALDKLLKEFPTPFHVYDEAGIVSNVRRLKQAFSWNAGFREFFAVKATPNPFLIKILAGEGLGLDCSSLAELALAEATAIRGERIMFTSNDTPAEDFQKAKALGAIINLDDLTHLNYLEHVAGLPELLSFRYNPGALREGNVIIGHPEDAKYGLTRDQLFDGYRAARDKGVQRFGIHTMVASNELGSHYFVETAEMLFRLVVEISSRLGITFDFVNLGGGIGIPYRPEEQPVDLEYVGEGVCHAYERILKAKGHSDLRVYLECGRMVTGPYGFLVTRVRHIKNTYKKFAGLDACMADLMRPGMYGAYHHITVPGKMDQPHDTVYDVTGSLCENNDKFAIDRHLPELEPGDVVIIHDTGAHGHAMGFNYNGKLRSAEVLLRTDGSAMQIRRAETLDDYFATLDFNALDSFKGTIS